MPVIKYQLTYFLRSPTTFWVLPRHTFGKLQAHTFPKYFFLTTLYSYVSLASFLKMNPMSGWKDDTLTLVTDLKTKKNKKIYC